MTSPQMVNKIKVVLLSIFGRQDYSGIKEGLSNRQQPQTVNPIAIRFD